MEIIPLYLLIVMIFNPSYYSTLAGLCNRIESDGESLITNRTSDPIPENTRERIPRANNVQNFKQAFHQLRYSESSSLKDNLRQNFIKAGINNILNLEQINTGDQTESSSKVNRRRANKRIYPKNLHFTKMNQLQGSWCQMDRALIKVRARGCQSKMVSSYFCYGQCMSLLIPQYKASGKYLQSFKSCGFCQPASWQYMTVRLECPSSRTPYRLKVVPVVKSCACLDVYRKKQIT